jgi:uncharacterized LabA/DUF88 family protein
MSLLGQEVSVVPSESARTLRSATFIDLWNLLRGASTVYGPTAMTFDWGALAESLRHRGGLSLGTYGRYASKVDKIHLLDEGTYVYGAPSSGSASSIGSRAWMNELAAKSGFRVLEGGTKTDKYQCRLCGGRQRIRRESDTDAHLISDLMWLAWQDRYDVAIVVSGDADLIPSIERVQLSGRKVVSALFDGQSKRNRQISHSSVSLNSLLADSTLYPGNQLMRMFMRGPLSWDTEKVYPVVLRLGHDVEALLKEITSDLPSYVRRSKGGWHQGVPYLKDIDDESERVRVAADRLADALDKASADSEK